jgi:hypothetical protein
MVPPPASRRTELRLVEVAGSAHAWGPQGPRVNGAHADSIQPKQMKFVSRSAKEAGRGRQGGRRSPWPPRACGAPAHAAAATLQRGRTHVDDLPGHAVQHDDVARPRRLDLDLGPRAGARTVLGRPERCELGHAFLRDHSDEGLRALGQLGVCLTCAPRRPPTSSSRRAARPAGPPPDRAPGESTSASHTTTLHTALRI